MYIFSKLLISKKLLKHLDFKMIIVVIILCIYSLANVYSSTHTLYKLVIFKHQLLNIFVSLVVFWFVLRIDYRQIANNAGKLYWISILLLLYTLIFGKVVNNARVWIDFRIFQFEPSEIVRLTLTILFARKIYCMEGNVNSIKNLAILLVYVLIPVLLILKQPALGMACICFFIAISIIYIAGIDLKILVRGFALLIIGVAIIWNTNLIKQYQKARFTSLLDQRNDTSGQDYQLNRSLIAIGSGGIIGDGYLNGKLIKNSEVPESSTDFIFAVVGEEWGLVGEGFLLALYSIMAYRIILIAKTTKDKTGSLICVGILSSFIFNVFVNIGMTIGIMPITGITLPFISYGGSSMVCNFTAVALVLNIDMRNKAKFFG